MRLRPIVPLILGLALAGGLPACSWFGSEEEAEKPAAEAAALRQPVPVQALRTIEIGRTRSGYAVSAFGTAPTTGFGGATLRPRREGQPGADGFIDFDFVAIPPDRGLNMPQGTLAAREIRADAQLSERALRGVRGIRVHTLTNAGQVTF